KALGGHTQLAFITGEAGRGKSALLHEFARRAESSQDNLLVVHGGCRMPSGVPDPYLPFRQAFAMLSGEVEDSWISGEISLSQAGRLWGLLPIFSQTLVDAAPGLIDTLVSGRELAARAAGFDSRGQPWQSALAHLLEKKAEEILPPEKDQADIYHQAIQVLKLLAAHHPLLIILDDLHWIDQASLGLLTALEQEMQNHPVLILGAYRKAEIGIDGGSPQALKSNLTEWKRQRGDIWIDLDETSIEEDRAFIDEYLDTEPNQLSAGFRKTLTRHTKGHGLFLQEMLRELQERGDLKKDGEDRWVERKDITWDRLPAKVEGVIEKRIERLDDDSRVLLEVASVVGVSFQAEVVAAILQKDKSAVVTHLVTQIGRGHQLVEDLGIERLNGFRLSRFRFSHALLQNYIYHRISESQRTVWHESVAHHLEKLYTSRSGDIAGVLARHYEIAGDFENAITHYRKAGVQAIQSFAYAEAIVAFKKMKDLYVETGNDNRVGQTLMTLGFLYHNILEFHASQKRYQEAFEYIQQPRISETPINKVAAPHSLRLSWMFSDGLVLDPIKTSHAKDSKIHQLLFSGLTYWDSMQGIFPDVAKRWEVGENGTEYVFHLREDVFWSDGIQVTAYDFEYSWLKTLNPDVKSPNAPLLFCILNARKYYEGRSSVEDIGLLVEDPFTMRVKLEKPTGYFLDILCHPATSPVPQHVIREFHERWVDIEKFASNGPFLIEKPDNDSMLHFSRNKNYHLDFVGNIETIRYVKRPQQLDDLIHMYDEDNIDYLDITSYPSSYFQALVHRFPSDYFSYSEPAVTYFIFKTNRSPFNDIRLRRAFVAAVDNEKLANVVLGGREIPAYGSLVPPGIPGYCNLDMYQYNPEQARKFFEDIGIEGKEFPIIDVFVSEWKNDFGIAEYLTQSWDSCFGVKSQINIYPYSEMMERWRNGQGDILISGWILDFPDPENIHSIDRLEHLGLSDWQTQDYARALEEAQLFHQPNERKELFEKVEKKLHDQFVIIPLSYYKGQALKKPWVFDPSQGLVNRSLLKDIIIEPH
ncbi:MAG: ABC transporter substrate-binding protein, partial [Anaerolineae bacterium]|nr:ABC transporter substrate-binding protein [Anaerolineae bacterium]